MMDILASSDFSDGISSDPEQEPESAGDTVIAKKRSQSDEKQEEPSTSTGANKVDETTTTSRPRPLRRERKIVEKDKNFTKLRKSRSPRRKPSRSRSRSFDRPIYDRSRSRSPKRRYRKRRQVNINVRNGRNPSPPLRRLVKDVWNRNKNRSSQNNRSPSPASSRSRSRSRTPPRNRRFSRSPSVSPPRSPNSNNRQVNNVEENEKNVDKDVGAIGAPTEDTQVTEDEKQLVSVVVRQGDKQGSTLMTNGNRCRDFDEKGVCMRGELCPYDHGLDPVVLEDVLVLKQIYNQQNAAFNQNIYPGRMNMYSGDRQFLRPRTAGEYYPDNPGLDPRPGWHPGPFRPIMEQRCRPGLLQRPICPFPVPNQRELINIPIIDGPPPNHMLFGGMRAPYEINQNQPMIREIMFPVGPGPRQRPRFDQSRLGGKQNKNFDNCSLEVKKIPREKNNIMEIHNYFLRFGKILNIQINFKNDPEAALVTFSSSQEAHTAYKCTEAVLNNRFIRVFWHNRENEENLQHVLTKIPLKGPQDKNTTSNEDISSVDRPIDNSSTKIVIVPELCKKDPAEKEKEKVQAVEAIKRNQEKLAVEQKLLRLEKAKKKTFLNLKGNLIKRKQDIMSQQIEEQKRLIGKLESNKASLKVEERAKLMSLIKNLQESIEAMKKDLENAYKGQFSSSNSNCAEVELDFDEFLKTQREMLDAELELYSKKENGVKVKAQAGKTWAREKIADLQTDVMSEFERLSPITKEDDLRDENLLPLSPILDNLL